MYELLQEVGRDWQMLLCVWSHVNGRLPQILCKGAGLMCIYIQSSLVTKTSSIIFMQLLIVKIGLFSTQCVELHTIHQSIFDLQLKQNEPDPRTKYIQNTYARLCELANLCIHKLVNKVRNIVFVRVYLELDKHIEYNLCHQDSHVSAQSCLISTYRVQLVSSDQPRVYPELSWLDKYHDYT